VPVQQLAPGERRPGLKRDLTAAVGGTYPRLVDGDHAVAQGHLGGLAAMAHGSALGIVLALRAGDLADLGKQLAEDVQTDIDDGGEQSVARCEDFQLAFDPRGERRRQSSCLEVDQPESGHESQIASRGA
jgi:hypothetical protein